MTTPQAYVAPEMPAAATLPLVSVVIPTKNRANVLRFAIDSVLSQDYPNIQCIVVDGASSDGTTEVLREYGDRIAWLSEPDRGAFDAINRGWAMSHGEILTWLNADDVWVEGGVATAVRYFLERPDCDVVYGACGGIDAYGRLLDVFPARPWSMHNAVKYCDHIINQAAAFMSRGILEKVEFLYPAWCHDHDLWLRIDLAGGRFLAVPERLADARIWDDNLGANPSIVIPAKIAITRRLFARPDLPPSVRGLKRRAMSNSYLRGVYYLDHKKPAHWPRALALVARALAADPINSPYILSSVIGGAVRRSPIATPVLLSMRVARAGVRLAARALRAAVRLAAGRIEQAAPVTALSVGAIAGAASATDFESGAYVFAAVAGPLLLALIALRLARR